MCLTYSVICCNVESRKGKQSKKQGGQGNDTGLANVAEDVSNLKQTLKSITINQDHQYGAPFHL